MVQYFWPAIVGTSNSTEFAPWMKREEFNRFEECIDEFRDRFPDAWLSS